MQIPPLSVLVTFPPANYVNPELRGSELIVLVAIAIPLLLIVVGLRIYSRARISRNFGADDVCVILAMIPTMASTVIGLVANYGYGLNRHAWDVPFTLISLGWKLAMAAEVLFGLAVGLTKISMLFLTLRLTLQAAEGLRLCTKLLLASIVVQTLLYTFITIFQCTPISDFWTLSHIPQKCINHHAHLMAAGIINTVTDFMVVLLPIPSVWNLNVPRRQQIMVIMLFGAGFTVCFAGVVRSIYTYKLTQHYDVTWDAYPVWFSTSVELYVGIICAALPGSKPFFFHCCPKFFTSSTSSSAVKSDWRHPSFSTRGRSFTTKPNYDIEDGFASPVISSSLENEGLEDSVTPADNLPQHLRPPAPPVSLAPPPASHSPTGKKTQGIMSKIRLGDQARCWSWNGSVWESSNRSFGNWNLNADRRSSIRTSMSSFADVVSGSHNSKTLTRIELKVNPKDGATDQKRQSLCVSTNGSCNVPPAGCAGKSEGEHASENGTRGSLAVNQWGVEGSTQEVSVHSNGTIIITGGPYGPEDGSEGLGIRLKTEPRPKSDSTIDTFGYGRANSPAPNVHAAESNYEMERPRPRQLMEVAKMG